MKTIYLVMADSGEYDDARSWPVRAFRTRVVAEEHVQLAAKAAADTYRQWVDEGREGKCYELTTPYDPTMLMDPSTGVRYTVIEIPFGD